MTDAEMAKRLKPVRVIASPVNSVENRILKVGPTYVELQSAQSRTKKPRIITFNEIRSKSPTKNGMIIVSLKDNLGL